ncbi:TRAP transporter large permease [Streptosporangium sp. CA-115845]|uniref:TRAP transporter large permease n=1 Tax=Streptosporangium sp. CA-115845 TaxID=3240071 RepID=UPI003D8D3AD0
MPLEMIGAVVLIAMLLLMLARVPVAVSMAIPAMIGIYYLSGWEVLSAAVNSIVWQHTLSYSLVTIPMFLLMGEVLHVSGITGELYQAFRVWAGRMRGGLAVASIAASAGLAAASGSSIATTATMGTVSSKEMLNAGYDKGLAGGAIVAGGGLGILIPPSTVLVIYATLTEQSIGKLLIAGILPGIMLTLLFILTVMVSVGFNPRLAPAGRPSSWSERLSSLKYVIWVLVLFAVVTGGMYFGLFSPTEAASFGALAATVIVALRRSIGWEKFLTAVRSTVKTVGFVFAIIIAGFILNYFLAITRLPITISEYIGGQEFPPLLLAAALLLMYMLLGCVMDALAMLVVTLPIVFPIVLAMGWDPIWFGIVMVIVIEMGMITPPIGMNCFVLHGVAPELGLNRIFAGAIRFVIPMLIALILLYAFPQIALFLPGKM